MIFGRWMTYKCCFPKCKYETDDRALIEFHHVNPRELGNTLNRNVTIPLCPIHHKLIYHPDATSGQHSICHPGSMSVVQVARTNTGNAVIFRDTTGTEITVFMDSRECGKDNIYRLSWDLVNGIRNVEVSDMSKSVENTVDSQGYCVVRNAVYYAARCRNTALDLMASYVAQYMTRTKAEYDSMLDKARNDWKILHKHKL